MSGLRQLYWKVASLATAIAVVVGGGAWYIVARGPRPSNEASKHPVTLGSRATPPPPAVTVTSITPAAQSTGVNGTTPISVTFSAPLASNSPMPVVSPAIPGSWQRVGASTVEFRPADGFTENVNVTVTVPAGPDGVRSAAGGQLAAQVTSGYTTGSYGLMRAEQVLAQLGYLPLTWTPSAGPSAVPAPTIGAQLNAAFDPPDGSFSWQPGYPSELQSLWVPGQTSEVLTGAVMAFESDHSLDMDGIIGPKVWGALLTAAENGQDNTHGYTYALASQHQPETLTVWHNGKVILDSAANTGIAAAPTTVGTAPVYLRYRNQIMRGTNPDGTKYADPVSWVAYFRAGEAVHYFKRASYGFPQSLGCVELPYAQAEFIWPYLTYGTLVTVTAA